MRVSVLVLAVAVLSARVETFRRIADAPECTIPSVEIWLPLLLSIYDSLRNQKNEHVESTEKVDASVYESLGDTARRNLLSTRFRYVLPTAMFCWGCRSLLRLWTGLNSTYICPIVTGQQASVPAAQTFGLLLDLVLAVIVWDQLPSRTSTNSTPRRNVVLWSSTMAGAAVVWVLVGAIVYSRVHHARYYVVLWDVNMFSMLFSFAIQSLLFSVACIATLHSVS